MSIVDTAKDVYDLLKKGSDLETQEQLMKLREEAFEIQAENVSLKEQIQELEAARNLAAQLEFDGRVYWRIEGDIKQGPFCQQCFDSEGKLIRVQKKGGADWGGHWFDCHTCKSRFDID